MIEKIPSWLLGVGAALSLVPIGLLYAWVVLWLAVTVTGEWHLLRSAIGG